jgi:hypothetical protein
MRALQREMRRRTKVIRDLDEQRCPENKVTPELANDRRLGLHPIAIAWDECQIPFEHPEHGKELRDLPAQPLRFRTSHRLPPLQLIDQRPHQAPPNSAAPNSKRQQAPAAARPSTLQIRQSLQTSHTQ